MLFHASASVSPQEFEEHRAAPPTGDGPVHSGGKPKGEAHRRETFSSGFEIYGITAGGCREGKGREAGLQIPRRWHSWSSDQAPARRRWLPAREPINNPGQAVSLRDLGTRNSETVEVSQKLIFLKWEKDEAK